MRTELAFTLAKNGTKLNPFEIIPLKTTRKENNGKTKETLEREFLTLGTERIFMFVMMKSDIVKILLRVCVLGWLFLQISIV
jgi:hypothetical protein